MKILYVIPDGVDLGGIITHTEQMLLGLRDLGHTTTFVRLTGAQRAHGTSDERGARTYITGPGTGVPMNTVWGWRGPWISMVNRDGQRMFLDLARKHDVIVWGALYGLRNHATEGKKDWLRLFETGRPTAALVHDEMFRTRWTWAIVLEQFINGWACAHTAGYDAMRGTSKPRAVWFNPFDLTNMHADDPAGKRPIVFSVQTAKRWKRVDLFVRAAARKPDCWIVLAGDGIELRYMRSEDKCLPRMMDGKRRIWDMALANPRFRYLGVVDEAKRDRALRQSMVLSDLSLRNAPHGNRVIIEAVTQGCVPCSVPRVLSDKLSPWIKNEHYLPFPEQPHPSDVAELLTEYAHLDAKRYRRIVSAGQHMLHEYFDRRIVARRLLQLALDGAAGVYCKQDKPDIQLMLRGAAMFKEIFK